jgi:hypothetical protein
VIGTSNEGHCAGSGCWYTLPLDADGLVVAHSKAGTLDTCEGGGAPPVPDDLYQVRQLLDQLTELGRKAGQLALEAHRGRSAAFVPLHDAVNRMGLAVNSLTRARRVLEDNEGEN